MLNCLPPLARAMLPVLPLVLLAAGCDQQPDPPQMAFAAAIVPTSGEAGASGSPIAGPAVSWGHRYGDRVPRPDTLRALYLNGWTVGSRERMRELLRLARETEINGFVVDIKEGDSYLVYSGTSIPLAREIGAHERPATNWMPELVDSLKTNGIYSIARIVAFKDAMLATQRPDLAIGHVDGGIFRDRSGSAWVNPFDERVWDYNIAIAREALEMGFSELQWDYVRFPDVPGSMYRQMSFSGRADRRHREAIRDFVEHSQAELAEFGVPIAADIFGLVTHVGNDLGIGQQWEMLSGVTDVLLPMVYPSHYHAGSYGFEHPNAHPYEIVRVSMEEARLRNEEIARSGGTPADVVPWLQAFSAPWVDDLRYGPEHVRAQIEATYDAGLTGWILWHPGSRYEPFYAAFRDAEGRPSEIERSGWRVPRWNPSSRLMSPVIAQSMRERRVRELRLDSLLEQAQPPAVRPAALGERVRLVM